MMGIKKMFSWGARHRTSPHSSSDEDDVVGPSLPSHLRKRKHSDSDSDNDNSQSVIGPILPPHLAKSRKEERTPKSTDESDTIGPIIPPHLRKIDNSECHIIGPVLPPSFHDKCEDESNSSSDEDQKSRDHLTDDEEQGVSIGPMLPPWFKKASTSHEAEDEESFGPALPPHLQQASASCDDDVIGPLPSEMMTGDVSVSMAAEFEQRAKKMKDKLTDKLSEDNAPKQRESWMTEVPTGMKKNFGLTARTFSKRAMPEKDLDTSVWTDTPADKERKMREAEQKGSHRSHKETVVPSSKQDKEYEHSMRKHDKSKRTESLLEMHEKKRKKKKKKEKDKPKERQPFDRDRDLQVNKFDEAQRKSIIKKSQLLNSRFSHAGSTSSFL